MRITIWGARGSIPVSGPGFVRYGGDTTCLEIRAAGRAVLVDAGTGIRRAGERLLRDGVGRIALLLTHAHWDHLLGFPFFAPLYVPGVRIDVEAFERGQPPARAALGRVMHPPGFPVRLGEVAAQLRFRRRRGSFALGALRVDAIPLSHPNGGLGFAFEEGGRRVVFLTDNELGFVHPGGRPVRDYVRFAAGAALLLHDAEYTPAEGRSRRGWGHSSWREAVDLALASGARRLGLWHHNMARDDAALERMVAACRRRIAAAGGGLECFAARQGQRLRV